MVDYRPLHMIFGEQVELLGYQVVGDEAAARSAAVAPCAPPPASCSVTLRLLWRAGSRLPVDYNTTVLLLDMSGTEVARTPNTGGVDPFPSTWWPAAMMLSDQHILDLSPAGAPALLRVRVQVFDGAANKRLPIRGTGGQAQDGTIGELKRRMAAAAVAMPARAALGDGISLVDSSGVRWSNGHGEVSLTWRAEKSTNTEYTVFIHLLDAQDHILAQSDAPPRGGSYPTHAWSPGETVIDTHQFNIDQATLGNVAHIAVGMYTAGDGRRLPVSTGGDVIILSPQTSETP
jgi:hypothetical protein